MGPKRIPDIDEQIIKQGCLIKSPPSYIFNKKGSWKARLLKLCKTSQGSFILRYYGYDGIKEDWKGDILISNIKSVELGKNLKERISSITRLFNNSPDHILCIRTEQRDYYLVDDSTENIAEWQKYIMDAWEKVHQKITIGEPTNPSANLLEFLEEQEYMKKQQKEVTRPYSYPEDCVCSGQAKDEESNRQRSHTDPETWKSNKKTLSERRKSGATTSIEEEKACKQQDSKTLPTFCRIPTNKTNNLHKPRRHSSAVTPQSVAEGNRSSDDKTNNPQKPRRHSSAAPLQSDAEKNNRSSDELTDRAYVSEPELEPEPESESESGSESESVYDVPRPSTVILNKSGSQDSVVEQEETSESDDDSSGDDIYEDMKSIARAINAPTKPLRNFTPPAISRYNNTQGSRLKKAQILKMMYESHSDSDLVSIRVSVPTDHLQKYLGLEEIGEGLRVSKWKGPAHIGCRFHHGDLVQSINDLRVGSVDWFFQMLTFSISSEVNLLLTRDKKAPVFHQEGCTCDSS